MPINPINPPVYTASRGYVQTGAASLSVTTASSRVALPAGPPLSLKAIVTNAGASDAWVKMGDNTVVADTTTGIRIVAGASVSLATTPNPDIPALAYTNIAGITGSGTATLFISTGYGDALASGLSAGGSAGGGGGVTGPAQVFEAHNSLNITTAATFFVKAAPGILQAVVLGTKAASAATLTLYDSLTASGTKIATIDLTSDRDRNFRGCTFANGLTAVTSATPGDVTIVFD
jgi:hypothetical protein